MTFRSTPLSLLACLLVAVSCVSCGGKSGPNKVNQLTLAFDGTIDQQRKKDLACRTRYVLSEWEKHFGFRSRPITIMFRDGPYFIKTSSAGVPVLTTEDFFAGANYATTVTGTMDDIPNFFHLLCHINLVGNNTLSQGDMADMGHTHSEWWNWDSMSLHYGIASTSKTCYNP